ncbi:MAG: Gfo/Idh/MocA family oxidoreductase, partial [Bacteroidota bacterium]|nr:Gfo/Idh/MocA family oxidoreductase [Bacteroidota bacterium]
MSGSLKFAIIGCGRIAQRHAEHIANQGKLVAVCDVIPEKAKALADKYAAAAYDEVGRFLQEIPGVDVVSVCSPNGLHAEHTIRSLQAGFHVLCEKPMA